MLSSKQALAYLANRCTEEEARLILVASGAELRIGAVWTAQGPDGWTQPFHGGMGEITGHRISDATLNRLDTSHDTGKHTTVHTDGQRQDDGGEGEPESTRSDGGSEYGGSSGGVGQAETRSGGSRSVDPGSDANDVGRDTTDSSSDEQAGSADGGFGGGGGIGAGGSGAEVGGSGNGKEGGK